MRHITFEEMVEEHRQEFQRRAEEERRQGYRVTTMEFLDNREKCKEQYKKEILKHIRRKKVTTDMKIEEELKLPFGLVISILFELERKGKITMTHGYGLVFSNEYLKRMVKGVDAE